MLKTAVLRAVLAGLMVTSVLAALVGDASSSSADDVGPGPLVAAPGDPLSIPIGVAYSSPLARFRDSGPPASIRDYTATIDWGDGTPVEPGAVTALDGTNDCAGDTSDPTHPAFGCGVSSAGTHVYAFSNTYSLVVTITKAGDSGASSAGTVQVTDQVTTAGCFVATGPFPPGGNRNPPPHPGRTLVGATPAAGQAPVFSAPVNSPTTALVAELGGITESLADYRAQIDWGDNDISDGQITTAADGSDLPCVVSAEHTYSTPGIRTITTTITNGQATVTVQAIARAYPATDQQAPPAVGVLTSQAGPQCTATVVDLAHSSAATAGGIDLLRQLNQFAGRNAQNVVVTANHCIGDYLKFSPGYRGFAPRYSTDYGNTSGCAFPVPCVGADESSDPYGSPFAGRPLGTAPLGTWSLSSGDSAHIIHGPAAHDSDPNAFNDYDYAFLVMDVPPASGQTLTEAVGGGIPIFFNDPELLEAPPQNWRIDAYDIGWTAAAYSPPNGLAAAATGLTTSCDGNICNYLFPSTEDATGPHRCDADQLVELNADGDVNSAHHLGLASCHIGNFGSGSPYIASDVNEIWAINKEAMDKDVACCVSVGTRLGESALEDLAAGMAGIVEGPPGSEQRDVTPPTTAATGWDGWNTAGSGNVSLSASDDQSGVAKISWFVDGQPEQSTYGSAAVVPVSGPGRHLVVYWATDAAGNTEFYQFFEADIDDAGPTITSDLSPPPNSGGWNNTPVTVSSQCADSVSGVASCPPPATITTEGASQHILSTATDNAGNTTMDEVTVSIDRTPPVVTATKPTANGAGWYHGSVTVFFHCADALSQVAACSSARTLTRDGAEQTVTGSATDNAGNSVTTSFGHINIDATPPTITAVATTQPNGNGWYGQPVTIHFTCTDAMSGIASCPADVTLSTEGANQSVSGVATDRAGNTASVTVSGLNVDRTAPTVSYQGNRDTYTVDQTVNLTCAASDALSGLSTNTCTNIAAPAWTLPLGTTTYRATATDRAGNSYTATATVTVVASAQSVDNLISAWIPAGDHNGLTAKADAITAAPNANARQGKLTAFANQVDASVRQHLLTIDQANGLKRISIGL